MGTTLRLLGIGWFVALCIVGGVIGGLLLDRFLKSDPLFTLVGLGAGLALAGFGTYRMLIAVLAESGDSRDQRKG